MFRYLVIGAALLLAGCDASTFPGGQSGEPAQEIGWASPVPFGKVGKVCEARGRKLGTRVERFAGGYALYDPDPGAGGTRNFHITGFSDGCPRRVTAATVLVSSPSSYEQFRFGPAGGDLPYARTDAAYDRIKRQVCGAGKRKPCGSRIGSLDRSTFFISAYRRLGDNSRWAETLIHNGEVVGSALKAGD